MTLQIFHVFSILHYRTPALSSRSCYFWIVQARADQDANPLIAKLIELLHVALFLLLWKKNAQKQIRNDEPVYRAILFSDHVTGFFTARRKMRGGIITA